MRYVEPCFSPMMILIVVSHTGLFFQASEANVGKKSKTTRDRDRDVSEHIALGQSNINATGAVEHAYDQRLFDQEQGVASGFHGDDAYDVYDKPLFHEKVQIRISREFASSLFYLTFL